MQTSKLKTSVSDFTLVHGHYHLKGEVEVGQKKETKLFPLVSQHPSFSFWVRPRCMRRPATAKGRTALESTLILGAAPSKFSLHSICCGILLGYIAGALSVLFWIFQI